MARDPGITFRVVPPIIMRRACLLAAHGAAGPSCDGGDVLRKAVDVGLLVLESAQRGHAGAVELASAAGANVLDHQVELYPPGSDAPPALRSLVGDLAAEGIPAGTLAPSPKGRKGAKTPAEPKPETPIQIGWRTWRARYLLQRRRPYSATSADGPAMIRLVDLAVGQLEALGRPLDDLERLLVHRWDRYLADPGQAKERGGPGWNAERSHALQWAEQGIPSYGTPWDKAEGKASGEAREPQPLPPVLPGGKRYAGRPGSGPAVTHQTGDDWKPKGAP